MGSGKEGVEQESGQGGERHREQRERKKKKKETEKKNPAVRRGQIRNGVWKACKIYVAFHVTDHELAEGCISYALALLSVTSSSNTAWPFAGAYSYSLSE